MSAAPGAERLPDEMELLDGSELCLHELEIEKSLRELRAMADAYEVRKFMGDLQPDSDETTVSKLTATSQNLIWHVYDTGILISRQESFDVTKTMVCELSMRVHDMFGIDDTRPNRGREVIPDSERQRENRELSAQNQNVITGMTENPPRGFTIPTFVQTMAVDTAEQLQKDLMTQLGLQIDTLPPAIAERVRHDDFMQTMMSLRDLGRVCLSAPLLFGGNKLQKLGRLAERLATRVAP